MGSARARQRQDGARTVELSRAVPIVPDAADAIAEEGFSRAADGSVALDVGHATLAGSTDVPAAAVLRHTGAGGKRHTTQMRRSSSMVMPRGVDKQDETDANQTGDRPAETEKKP